MRLKMFAIHDKKAQVYNTPFFFAHDGQAVRAFSDLVNDPQSSICKHPEDFSLFGVAVFDDELGRVVSYDIPERVVEAAALSERLKNA